MTKSRLLGAVCICAMIPLSTYAASFEGLGSLSDSIVNSNAHGISPDGSTIVGTSLTATGTQAFYWTASSGMQGLYYPSGKTFSNASAASYNGDVISGDSLTD